MLVVPFLLALVGVAIGLWGQSSHTVADGAPRVAVLRFENLSSDEKQTYFAEGMAEDITKEISGRASRSR